MSTEPIETPPPEVPASDWSRPGRTAARLARHVEVSLGELDLSLSQYRLLMFLSERAEMASRLADSLAVTRPSVTAVVDGLVARELVERRPCEGDRRRVDHVLTAAGRRLLSAADDQADARLATVAAQLGDRKGRDLLGGLHHWRAALDRFAATRRAVAR